VVGELIEGPPEEEGGGKGPSRAEPGRAGSRASSRSREGRGSEWAWAIRVGERLTQPSILAGQGGLNIGLFN